MSWGNLLTLLIFHRIRLIISIQLSDHVTNLEAFSYELERSQSHENRVESSNDHQS